MMKKIRQNFKGKLATVFILFFMMTPLLGQNSLIELKGTVLDSNSKNPLESVSVNLNGTNVSTMTNSEGLFILKIKNDIKSETLIVSLIGYMTQEIQITSFTNNDFKILMDENVMQLSEVNLKTFKEAENLVRKVFENKAKNNFNQSIVMTAFYRETIKRRNTNVSLTEAVVNLHKKSYVSNSKDEIELQKARKSTNYKKLDTLAFKLQGGPFSTLYLDMMKYPEYIFTNETIPEYDFSFDPPSTVNNRSVYVVKFQQKQEVEEIGYYGKLYIDVESLALASATYSLNLDGRTSVKDFLVEKKPRDVVVYPTETAYKVNYREKDGKWFYSYGSAELTFKVDRKDRLFNQVYSISSEMAVTDWEVNPVENPIKMKTRLRPTMILADRISGFSDPNFWGKYNLIEPEKSIESAIDKIKRKLKKEGSSQP